MQNDGELAGDSHDRTMQPAPFGDGHAPGLQRAPAVVTGQQGERGLHQRSAHAAIAGHGYSPLSAGHPHAPLRLGVGAAAPAAPVIASRLGTKIVVPAGLMLMAAGFFVASTLGSGSAYFGPVIGSMVLMAVGLGLVTAPSTGAILAVLPLGKAGVGSAVNHVTRELGGTFGVAVVGAVFSSVYGPRLAQLLHGTGLPALALAAARQSPAAALLVAGQAPPSAHAVIIDAADRAFVACLSRGSLVCAAVVALGAVFAFLVLPCWLSPPRRTRQLLWDPSPARHPQRYRVSHEIRQADRPAAEGSHGSDGRRHVSAVSRPRTNAGTPGRAAGLRDVRAEDGIGVVPRQAAYRCRLGRTTAWLRS